MPSTQWYNQDMPIYEYKCTSCGMDFEKLVFGSKTPECPECGSAEVKKKLSVFGMSGVENAGGGCSSGSCGGCSSDSCG